MRCLWYGKILGIRVKFPSGENRGKNRNCNRLHCNMQKKAKNREVKRGKIDLSEHAARIPAPRLVGLNKT
jgi:hypothetical protein